MPGCTSLARRPSRPVRFARFRPGGSPATTPSEASEPPPSKRTRPERFTIESATWNDVPTLEVLEDVVRRTGYALRITAGTRDMLANETVTLTVKNEKAHKVVGKLILRYDLDFTVRENEVRIFVDDD